MTAAYCRSCGQLIYREPGQPWQHTHSRRAACDFDWCDHVRVAEPEAPPEAEARAERERRRSHDQGEGRGGTFGRYSWEVPDELPESAAPAEGA